MGGNLTPSSIPRRRKSKAEEAAGFWKRLPNPVRVGIVFVISLLIVDEIRALKSYAYLKLVVEPQMKATAKEMQANLQESMSEMREIQEELSRNLARSYGRR